MEDPKDLDQVNSALNNVLNRVDIVEQRLEAAMNGPICGVEDLRECQTQLLLQLRAIRGTNVHFL
ncbi:hypothetical protein PsorP6_001484 [Peronosclerospora sorghi]|uniref:Uncharacterized protein n=1 Tax=Peronosclerospora sorghi TaxID=230839 RepID=A0ACC0WWG4_9STRA|nr:hypothetical protein PsorP6_001484 [Peronosclerospora sorghi]